jgi:hypothetical protein
VTGPAEDIEALLRKAKGGLDRQTAHELLDAALDLAGSAADRNWREGFVAQAAALALSRAAAGWTVPVERPPDEWDQLAQDDPERWRADAVSCMQVAFAVVPQPVINALMFALVLLDTSHPTPAILTPAPREAGHGKSTRTRRAVEEALLLCLDIARANGRLEKVRGAMPVGESASDKWLKEWRRREGDEHVARVRDVASRIGRGENLDFALPEEFLPIRLVGGNVTELTRQWLSAKAKAR